MGHTNDHITLDLLKYTTNELKVELTSGHLLGRY